MNTRTGKIVQRTRSSGETGILLKERKVPIEDPTTQASHMQVQGLIYWPEQGMVRWTNEKYFRIITEKE